MPPTAPGGHVGGHKAGRGALSWFVPPVGALGLVVVVASVGVIAWSWRRARPEPGLLPVLLPPAAIGMISGFTWRVMTAAVIGANIGAGLLVMGGTPVVLALAVLALVSACTRRFG